METNLWQVLAFVAAMNGMILMAVVIGAYAVYKTKREDGYVFKSPQPEKSDKPVLLDDGIGSAYDFEEEGMREISPEELARNNKFLKNFFAGSKEVVDETSQ